jgi:hypothetical protein
VSGWVLISAANDADPFAPSVRQSVLYVGVGPALILLWGSWATYSCVLVVRRRVLLRLALLLTVGVLWGGFLCVGLYQVAGEFIDQTSRFHGTSWPFVHSIF